MRQYECHCDCGANIITIGCSIRKGKTLSCGCIRKEKSAKRAKEYFHLDSSSFVDNPNHGRLYMIWYDMNRRCSNPNRQNYIDYGGRGISVCSDWADDYDMFARWAMANGYNPKLTLDRIDCNGDYTPTNCRWASQRVQANNKRNNRMLTVSTGETHTISEWSSISGINRHTIAQRIRNGWSVDEAVTKPARK